MKKQIEEDAKKYAEKCERMAASRAMKSKQIFKGDKPAGLKCKDCDERTTCLESDINVEKVSNIKSY